LPPFARSVRPHRPGRPAPVSTVRDSRPACRSQAVPAYAAPAGRPDGAAPCQSIPDWDAGMHPGQASALADRARSRPRLPLGGAIQT
jgi:hypothetical protein